MTGYSDIEEDSMADKWITIKNSKLKGAPAVRVTERAFKRVWKAKGFTIVKDDGGK